MKNTNVGGWKLKYIIHFMETTHDPHASQQLKSDFHDRTNKIILFFDYYFFVFFFWMFVFCSKHIEFTGWKNSN
jgi:hypothetical protein